MRSDISCKLSQETISIKYQILFSVKNKKIISKCILLKFLHSMQNVNSSWNVGESDSIMKADKSFPDKKEFINKPSKVTFPLD